MMPLPGFQKPMPNFAPAVARKSYTSRLRSAAVARSDTPPALVASIRWSQWMVEGTAVRGRPEDMNWRVRGSG